MLNSGVMHSKQSYKLIRILTYNACHFDINFYGTRSGNITAHQSLSKNV